jgi:hypothetical protein
MKTISKLGYSGVLFLFMCLTIFGRLAVAESSEIAGISSDQIAARFAQLKSKNPELVELFTAAEINNHNEYDNEKKTVQMIRLGRILNRPQRAILLMESIHGDESLNITLRLAEQFAQFQARPNPIKKYFDDGGLVYIVPRFVYDGNARVNPAGLDLNRQFLLFGTKEYYSSQNEISNFTRLIESEIRSHSLDLQAVFDYHCCDKSIYYPWAAINQNPPPEDVTLFNKIGSLMRVSLGNDFKFERIQSRPNSSIDNPDEDLLGTSMDYFYGKYGAYAFTVEGEKKVEGDRFDRHLNFYSQLFVELSKIPVQPWNGNISHPVPHTPTEAIRDFIDESNGKDIQLMAAKIPISLSASVQCRDDDSNGIMQKRAFFRITAQSSEKSLRIGTQPDLDGLFPDDKTEENGGRLAPSGFIDSYFVKSKNFRLRGLLRSPEFLNDLIVNRVNHFQNDQSLKRQSGDTFISDELAYGMAYEANIIFMVWGKTSATFIVARLKPNCTTDIREKFSFNIADFPYLQKVLQLKKGASPTLADQLRKKLQPKNYENVVSAAKAFNNCSGISISPDGYILTAKHCVCPMLVAARLSDKISLEGGFLGCLTHNQTPNKPIYSGPLGMDEITAEIMGIKDQYPVVVAVGKRAYTQRGNQPSLEETAKLNSDDDDWAILKYHLEQPTHCVPIAELSQSPKLGTAVWAVGAPRVVEGFGYNKEHQLFSATGKIIKSRTDLEAVGSFGSARQILKTENPNRQFLSTVKISPGFSGSGLFNRRGELLGINTDIIERSDIHLGTGSTRIDYIKSQVLRLLGPGKTSEIFNCPK